MGELEQGLEAVRVQGYTSPAAATVIIDSSWEPSLLPLLLLLYTLQRLLKKQRETSGHERVGSAWLISCYSGFAVLWTPALGVIARTPGLRFLDGRIIELLMYQVKEVNDAADWAGEAIQKLQTASTEEDRGQP